MSRRRAPSTGARPRCTMTKHVFACTAHAARSTSPLRGEGARRSLWHTQPSQPMTKEAPLGLVLAGGLARRMGGGDKARIAIGGRTILERVLARLKPQCAQHHPQRQRRSGALRRHAVCRWWPIRYRTSPVRSPASWPASTGRRRTRLPSPTSRACRATARSCRTTWCRGSTRRARRRGAPLACARSGDWRHPVVGLWPVALREDLRRALTAEGLHKIEIWTARHGVAIADWPAVPVDPFFNVNTPEDVAAAERIAAQHGDI